MKKLSLFIICALSMVCLKLWANPLVPPPFVVISELAFDEEGKWMIEIDFRHSQFAWWSEDYKIKVITSSGEAEVVAPVANENEYRVLTADHLDRPLSINQKGDSIAIEIYSKEDNTSVLDEWYDINSLCFGDHPNATVRAPLSEQSLLYHLGAGIHVICHTPNIGDSNELATDFLYTTVKGNIYDADLSLMKNILFIVHSGKGYNEENTRTIYANKYGEYEGALFAVKYDNLYLYRTWDGHYRYYTVKEEKVDLSAGGTIDLDFHVIKSYLNIEDNIFENQLVKFYPNPVNEDRIINYKIDLPINTMETEVEVYSLNGELLLKQKISDNSGVLNLIALIKGAYILNLVSNKKIMYSTKITLN